jgi:hypothetical protein
VVFGNSCTTYQLTTEGPYNFQVLITKMKAIKRNFNKRASRAKPTNRLRVSVPRSDTIERSMPLFPARKRATLTYHTNIDLFCGASGTVGNYIFVANGLYDPDYSGTGHQPMGFDQMMVFYYHYTVLRAKITVNARSNSGTYGGFAAISRNGSTTGVTVPDDLVEAGNIEYRYTASTGQIPNHISMKMDMDVGKFAGIDDLMDDDTYRGSSTANPADGEYFHLSFWSPFTTTAFTCNFDVLIEFEAIFTEPKKPSASLVGKECTEEKTFEVLARPGKPTLLEVPACKHTTNRG